MILSMETRVCNPGILPMQLKITSAKLCSEMTTDCRDKLPLVNTIDDHTLKGGFWNVTRNTDTL